MPEYLTYDDFTAEVTRHGWKVGARGAPFMKNGFPTTILKVDIIWPPCQIDVEVPCNYAENHWAPLDCCYQILAQALAMEGVVSRA